MQLAPIITMRDIPHSVVLENEIKSKITKLETFYHRIMGCRVLIEQSQRHKHQGKLYHARIDLTVPGNEIVVNKVENEDVYILIRDAFQAMRRKLQDISRRKRGVVKDHVIPLVGRVARVFPEQGYGFIEAFGEDYYFSFANLVNTSFELLEPGTEVQFIETQGAEGLQANRITIGKHHNSLVDESNI